MEVYARVRGKGWNASGRNYVFVGVALGLPANIIPHLPFSFTSSYGAENA
jgi:hypothetical protein